jgi:hypothetical protein
LRPKHVDLNSQVLRSTASHFGKSLINSRITRGAFS